MTTIGRLLDAMAWGRIALGVGSVAAPGAMARGFGVQDTAELRYVTRVFGARAVALGVAYLTLPPASRTRLQRLCLGVDTSDTISGLRELRQEGAPRGPMAAMVMITGPYAVIGAARVLTDLAAVRRSEA